MIHLSDWKKKYPTIEDGILIQWVSQMTMAEVKDPELQDKFMKDKYKAYTGGKPAEELPEAPKPEEPEEPQEEEDDEDPEDPEPDEQLEDEESMEDEETLEDETEDEDETDSEDQLPVGEEEPSFKDQVKTYKEKERFESLDPKIPFENPDLSELTVPLEHVNGIEDKKPEPVRTFARQLAPRFRPPIPRQEMVTKTVTYQEYDEIIRPFKPLLEDIKRDPSTLNKFAAQMDGRYMPPYMQIKSYILNHPIKDPNNSQVVINVVSETNAKNIERRYVVLTQANDITRTLAEQGWFEEALWNYDVILDKMLEERKALVSLVFVLENYCEQKQVSPFELSIPKKVLMDSVEQSFQAIKTLITDNVIREMSVLRTDLKGEMGDVSGLVEENMTRFDSNIQEAVQKVLWKVKTDVESTNLEDIKRSILFILNKRAASYSLGGVATAIVSMMCDDLERKLLQIGFKLDDVKEQQKYTGDDFMRRLGYKTSTPLFKALLKLHNSKVVRKFENNTYSL